MAQSTFLGCSVPFCFLDKQGKHLRLHKFFHKLAAGLGGDGFAERSLLQGALPALAPFDVRCIVANGSDKKVHKTL